MKRKLILILLILGLFPSVLLSFPWGNGQSANLVIGQSDFTSGTNACSANQLGYPSSIAIDYINSKFYVCDCGNSRILRFSYPPVSNQPTAEMVFGQADYTSSDYNRTGGNTPSANSLRTPRCIVVHNGNLWVVDMWNNRVLRWSNAYTATIDASADLVLGQEDFVSYTDAVLQNRFNFPSSISIDNADNLWVHDTYSNRVLRFSNCESKSNGANADGVLGQTDYISDGDGTTAGKFSTTTAYSGLANYGTTLWVTDNVNNRILRFDNAASKADGADADGVLGHSNFITGTANDGGSVSNSGLNFPGGLFIDQNGDLYVADVFNHRVLIYTNAAAKTNGGSADYVLGQPNFSSSTSGTTSSIYYGPSGISGDLVNSEIFIADESNSRVLLLFPSGSASVPTLTGWATAVLIGFILIMAIRKLYFS